MADWIQIMAGDRRGMPELPDRTPAYVRDEQALYIGTEDGNLLLCRAETPAKVAALEKAVTELNGQLAGKLTASKAAAQDALPADAAAADIVAAVNSLIAALKVSGVMSTGEG